jgi:2,4-dienoyl-CoA reductase-like NADH-dependent reductase (Old Yellow Enzyme family)
MGGIYEWHQLNEMIEYLLQGFDKSGLRMLDISCANADYFKTSSRAISIARSYWPHLLIGGASLSADQAQSEIDNGHLDMVTWGRALIANPNMISKFQDGTPLAEFNRDMLQSLE